ncbi:hypothetical protein [Halorubellus litoreus]|uniref:Uncharacterized protein n=1 Tax=Halorubellus litoreus TaxID=755308 RepID=A0ABD5VG94_9EURY
MERTDTDQRTKVSWTTLTTAAVSRYDVALGVIPVFLALPALAAVVSGVPLEPLVGVGAVACTLVVADVCFLHPPAGTGVAGRRDDATGRRDDATGRPDEATRSRRRTG